LEVVLKRRDMFRCRDKISVIGSGVMDRGRGREEGGEEASSKRKVKFG